MREQDTGEGRLMSLAADSKAYIVDYILDVDTEVQGQSARFSPPRVERRYLLQVKLKNREKIPDGEYTLKTSSEILRVRKTGQTWQVVAP